MAGGTAYMIKERGNQVKFNIYNCMVDEGDIFPLENILKQLIPV